MANVGEEASAAQSVHLKETEELRPAGVEEVSAPQEPGRRSSMRDVARQTF